MPKCVNFAIWSIGCGSSQNTISVNSDSISTINQYLLSNQQNFLQNQTATQNVTINAECIGCRKIQIVLKGTIMQGVISNTAQNLSADLENQINIIINQALSQYEQQIQAFLSSVGKASEKASFTNFISESVTNTFQQINLTNIAQQSDIDQQINLNIAGCITGDLCNFSETASLSTFSSNVLKQVSDSVVNNQEYGSTFQQFMQYLQNESQGPFSWLEDVAAIIALIVAVIIIIIIMILLMPLITASSGPFGLITVIVIGVIFTILIYLGIAKWRGWPPFS